MSRFATDISVNDIVTVIRDSPATESIRGRGGWVDAVGKGTIGFVTKVNPMMELSRAYGAPRQWGPATVDIQYIGRGREVGEEQGMGVPLDDIRKSTTNEILNITLRAASGLTTGLDTVPLDEAAPAAPASEPASLPLRRDAGRGRGGGRKSKSKSKRR